MDINLRVDLNKIFDESFKIKMMISKAVANDDQINKSLLYDYINSIKGFIKQYDDYSKIVKREMMAIDPVGDNDVITYQTAKSFIYSNNDYSSILPFTDAIIKGINDLKFNNKSDIDSFSSYMISKCFKSYLTSTYALIDNAANIIKSKTPTDDKQIVKYNIVKDYDLFNPDDAYELATATSNVLSFISDDVNTSGGQNLIEDDTKYPLFINSVFDYINYSLATFAIRIFILAAYEESYKAKAITESYSEEMEKYVWVMKKTDEIIARDYTEVEHFCKRIRRFCEELGIEFEENKFATAKYPDTKLNSNKLYNEILENELIKFLSDLFNWVDERRILQFNTELRALYYSNKQSLQSNITPKDELMYMIKNVASKDMSLESLKNTLKEFALCNIKILYLLNSRIRELLSMEAMNTEKPFMTLSQDIKNSETFKILGELYRDVATVILYKFKDIEVKYNKLKNKSMHAISSKLEIDDYSSMDSMRSAVPEMLRNPEEFKKEFIRSEFEYLQLESAYIMERYDLQDDPYFTNFNEAFSISDIINKLLAFIASIKKNFTIFFNNEKYKKAVQWVNEHQQEMMNMTYSGTLGVYPYKEHIDISFANAFISTVNSFNENILKDRKNVDEFIDKLYKVKGKDLKPLFSGDKVKPQDAVIRYHNFVIFDMDPFQQSKIEQIKITDGQIMPYLKQWMAHVGKSTETLQALIDINKKLEDAVNNIKSKAVNIENKENKPQTNPTQQTTQQNDTKNDNPMESSSNNIQYLIMQITVASEKILGNLYDPIVQSFRDQYQYIKEAYTIGRK